MALKYTVNIEPAGDTWPLIGSTNVKGGIHSFSSVTAFNAFTATTVEEGARDYHKMWEPGMFAYVEEVDKHYKYDGTTWTEVQFGGGGGEEPVFPYDAVYFVSTNPSLDNIPTEESSTVSGLTKTTDMSHRYDCSLFKETTTTCYVYFAIPIVSGKDYEYLVNGMLTTAYELQNESLLGENNEQRNLYRLSNALGGSKITLLTKEF
jgi:hypothetical protein